MRKRRSYEAGHRPKFLVVVDETPECDRAWRFAARRVSRTGAAMVMLAAEPAPDAQDWLGVEDMLKAEAVGKAEAACQRAAESVRSLAGIEPECVVRLGDAASEIASLIDADEDIALLILAAGLGQDGPGPLVSTLATRQVARLPVPVVIVPGSLSDAEIDALA